MQPSKNSDVFKITGSIKQIMMDNFDQEGSSANGNQSTYSLAVIMTQQKLHVSPKRILQLKGFQNTPMCTFLSNMSALNVAVVTNVPNFNK